MTFEIEVNGRLRTVSVERAGAVRGRFRVAVDGTVTVVEAQRFGEYGVSMLFPDDAHATSTVQLAPGTGPGELLARLAGCTVPVVVNGRRTGRAAVEGSGGMAGEQKIVAPMPGRVVRVLVNTGDEVGIRQGVVVVEAMKMENELRSPKAGRIKEIAVAPGTSVEAGRVLVVIE